MEKNVGGIFAAIRIVLGILLIGLSVFVYYSAWVSPTSGMIVGLGILLSMGGFALITGIIQRCPINRALDRDTCQ